MPANERDEHILSVEAIGEAYGHLRLVTPRAEKQMRASLERYGQMSPVVVCRGLDDRHELLDGFKRLRACRELGVAELRVRILALGTRAAKAAMLCLNWTSGSVSDLEEGWVVHALCRDDGLTQVEVGHLLGRHKSWVSRRLSLVERLSDEVQSQLRLGLITGTMGRELAQLPRGNQDRVLAAIAGDGLGSREVTALVGLLKKSNQVEQRRILEAPREHVASCLHRPVMHDARLGDAGNELLRHLCRMEQTCSQVVSRVGVQGLSALSRSDLLVLAPTLGRAQRAGRQASEALQSALAAVPEARDDTV